jgi:branched-chain amino acid transport system ATP-binding protein
MVLLHSMDILLQLKNLSVTYGGVHALKGVDIEIDEGEIVALMGPNGAGKSTVLKALFGLSPIAAGEIFWHGSPLQPVSHRVVRMGISLVPQGRRVFSELTVEENLDISELVVNDAELVRQRKKEMMNLFPVLKNKRALLSGTLSGGEQQMVALARGLMTDPKVLLLDEPSLGLAPKIVKEVFAKIKEIGERHKTAILIVEHNIRSVLEVAHRAYVLDKGSVVFAGNAHAVEESAILQNVFLGS